jgi:alkyl hydroperoxide reductase subunit AhpF
LAPAEHSLICRIKTRRGCGEELQPFGRGDGGAARGGDLSSVVLLSDEDARGVRQQLQALADPVRLVHFTQERDLEYGRETRLLLQEVTALSDKLSLEVYDFLLDKDPVAAYRVDKVPATIVCGAKDYGIRFFGLPAGYEFLNLLDAMLTVSRGDSGLSENSKGKLQALAQPIHLEVFVTPT